MDTGMWPQCNIAKIPVALSDVVQVILHTEYDKFNSGVPGQNGIWVKFEHFTHIPFWPGTPELNLSYTVLKEIIEFWELG